MSKMVLKIGYNEYVLDAQDAVSIGSMLSRAEKYLHKGYGKGSIHYIWDDPTEHVAQLIPISQELYRMAKLAGNPDKPE